MGSLCGLVPARVVLSFLTSAGVVVLYMVRINMSVAIVAMVQVVSSSPSSSATAYCTAQQNMSWGVNDTLVTEGGGWSTSIDTTPPTTAPPDTLQLSGAQRGMVLGAFFYGYFITNIPGGRLAELYGTKKVFGGSMLISGALTLLTPLAARTSYLVLIGLRVLIGLANGTVYPAMNVMVAKWIPPMERPRFMSFSYMSNTLGTIITLPMCSLITASLGWPAVFYVTGAISLVWVLTWTLLMHDSPQQHPRISTKEKQYILDAISQGTTTQKPSRTPWKAIMLSLPLWGTTFAHIGSMFGFNLLLTQLPSYMNSILGFSITSNGFLSALPFLAQFVGSLVAGFLGDWMLTRGHISLIVSRKLFVTLSLVMPGLVLVVVGYVGCHRVLAVALLPFGTFFSGAICSGHMANHLDLSPNFAGTILGVSNSLAFMVSMCVPVIVGAMTPDQTLEQWRGVFWLTAAVYVLCSLAFLVFGATEIQPWNYEADGAKEKQQEEAKEPPEEENFLPLKQLPQSEN